VPESDNDQATPLPRAGVIGLGGIGHGLASSLVQAGVTVAVCDVREEATAAFRDGARLAATPAELAAHSDVVLVSVFDDLQVRAVLGGPDGVFAGAAPGTAVVILSTIPATTVDDMRAQGAPHGVTVVDCGVSGGPEAASSGEWVCMIGGSAEEVDRVRPVLDLISCLVLHMGRPGAGHAAKLARNLITYGAWYAAFEAQQLAEAAGIDLVKLGQATSESDKRIGGPSRLMFRTTTEPWPEDTDAGLVGAMQAALDMAHKDLVTILEFGAQLGVALPMGELAERRCNRVFGFPDE
jgi:3-hydroxyisobutyrate dehydrogenase